MPHKVRILKSKYNGKGFMDDRQELGEILCVTCDSVINISMCERGNVINKSDDNPCYNPDPITLGEVPLEDCCDKCE